MRIRKVVISAVLALGAAGSIAGSAVVPAASASPVSVVAAAPASFYHA